MSARWLVALCGVAGCATAAAPYRFQSELISGVTANVELVRRGAGAPRSPAADPAPRLARTDAPPARGAHARAPIIHADLTRADPFPREEVAVRTTPRPGLVLSRLPSPHRADGAIEVALAAHPAASELHALIGTRVTDDPLAFAVATAARLSGGAGPDPVPADGAALATWAGDHAASIDPAAARPGDLLAFDRAIGGRPASLWAVVASRDAGGVIEVLYVAGGVVRRGFVDPARPHVARDKAGVVHNTFLRHGKDWPPEGTRYLSGELLASAFRLE